MEQAQSPGGAPWVRNLGVTVLVALVAFGGWLSWRRPRAPEPPVAPAIQPTALPNPLPTFASAPISTGPRRDFTIGIVRDGAELADLQVFRQSPNGSLCVWLESEGVLSCDFLPVHGEMIRLAYAHWLYWGVECCRIGMFVVGAIRPNVDTVWVALGAGRWARAFVVTPARALGLPFRLFYVERQTGEESLNHRLPVIALEHGREVGRTSYLVLGG